MKLFFCDITINARDPDFDLAQFVVADTPSEAAKLYRTRGMISMWADDPDKTLVVVRELPTIMQLTPGVIDWTTLPLVIA